MIGLLGSCMETKLDVEEEGSETYLQIQKGTLLSSTDPRDDKIETLRILAFNKNGRCESNQRYNAELNDIVKLIINGGTYDFVFLANEPDIPEIRSALDGIGAYSDLAGITYPEQAFGADVIIPMFQEIKDVLVHPGSTGASVAGGAIQNPLVLKLERLAGRVDIILEAEEDLTNHFKGVTFSNIPEGVTLVSGDNGALNRNKTRQYTLADDPDYFTSVTPTAEQQAKGIAWVMQITRFIFPFNNFAPTSNSAKAIVLKVNLEDRYSPSAKLQIMTKGQNGATEDNYTLPYNSALLVRGSVKSPLNLNIVVSPWGEERHNWEAGNRVLNVSQIEARITDFNGARITFTSNMPVVRVLPDVYVGTTATTMKTEKVFNDLVLAAGKTSTSRFAYTYDEALGMGTGYMDILLDEYKMDEGTFLANQQGLHTMFRLILSAENKDGTNVLQREIKVNTSQYGVRFEANQWNGYTYVGAFFREDEVGERIITAQLPRRQGNNIGSWEIEVDAPYKDQIILSTTPSFDPYAGTDDPGSPETYPVRPNEYKQEEVDNDGTKIKGNGRVYFRVGWRGVNPNSGAAKTKTPRYATVTVTYSLADTEAGENVWRPTYKFYIRQGEAADYIMTPQTTIASGTLAGVSRTSASKFSPFNLTDSRFKSNPTVNYYQTLKTQGDFVDYPTQAGAFYQWGQPLNNGYDAYYRRAYNPVLPSVYSSPSGYWKNENWNVIPIWSSPASTAQTGYEYLYKDEFEVCPPGYHLPSDGFDNQISYNGLYPNLRVKNSSSYTDVNGNIVSRTNYSAHIKNSEWRQSLWKNPWAGETAPGNGEVIVGKGTANEKVAIRERSAPAYVENTDLFLLYGFYADGYFDRRPMKVQASTVTSTRVAVSANTANVAYRGTLVYNPENNAAAFFPASGRRRNYYGYLEWVSETSYYWSSSTAPLTPTETGAIVQSIWVIELSPGESGHLHTLPNFGHSIRCVKD